MFDSYVPLESVEGFFVVVGGVGTFYAKVLAEAKCGDSAFWDVVFVDVKT